METMKEGADSSSESGMRVRHGNFEKLYSLYCKLYEREERGGGTMADEGVEACMAVLKDIFALEVIKSSSKTCPHLRSAAQSLHTRQCRLLTSCISDSPLFSTWPFGVSEAKNLLDRLEKIGCISRHKSSSWSGARAEALRLYVEDQGDGDLGLSLPDLVKRVWTRKALNGQQTIAYFETETPDILQCTLSRDQGKRFPFCNSDVKIVDDKRTRAGAV